VVEELGGDVTDWKVGDRVIIHPNSWLDGPQENISFENQAGSIVDGTLRRYMIWPAHRLFRAPSNLDFEEASTLFTAGMTAYRALFYGPLEVKPGMTVLVQGTGGLSCFALQFAKVAGLKVMVTSSSDEKLEFMKKLGADETINYRKTPDW
jgi:NADPH:quinone reductase-like Zn-dependent oxidoreductase